MTRKMGEIIAGLDIGTSKIRLAAAEGGPGGELNITAVGASASRGVRKGMIVDLESAAAAVVEAADEAERLSGSEIGSVAAGISGEHIQGIKGSGVALIAGDRVKDSDIDSAIAAAEKMTVPEGREVVHAIPTGYRIDEQKEIKDPSGMHARHLEAEVHFITAAANTYENFCSCIRRAGIELEYIIFQPLASVHSVLSEDERDMGAVLLDMGGGTTDIAVVEDGAAKLAGVVPLGGESITNDIAVCLGIPQKTAEKIKIEYGRASVDGCPDKKIKVPGADKSIPLGFIAEIIEARVEEIFEFAARQISGAAGASMPACGMVITGGGSLLKGLEEKAGFFFDMPVRTGKPSRSASGIEKYGSGPEYSACAGLAGLCLLERRGSGGNVFSGPGMFGGINRKMKTWFRDLM